jgi:hypothetical protein
MKNNKICYKVIIGLLAVAVSLLLNGCAYPHYYYSPNIQNVPLFDSANTFTGHAAAGAGIVNNCVELQAGYSLPGDLALTAGFMTGGNSHSFDQYKDFSRLSYFEVAFGIYKPIKKTGIFELYGGYGHNSQRHAFSYVDYSGPYSFDRQPDGTADMSFSKIFIQPDIGIKVDWFEAAFSCRLSYLNFKNIQSYNTVYHLDEINILRQNSSPWLIEPAFTFRGGSKSVMGQLQLGIAARLTNPDLELMTEPFRISMGLHIKLFKQESR